ncbi:glucose sorbosone dehydrogenase [Opitutus sp. ER46]|nr:glucose sorbosone dehydrogenase [Opitutus sp. ER46]
METCSGCHGADMRGGKAPSLLGREWKHGGDDAALERSIREGYPESGMPAFRETLNPAEVHGLIALMRETGTRTTDPLGALADGLPLEPQRSEEHAYRFETVVEGLEVPWSFVFLPDGRILVTERAGRLRVIEGGRLAPEPVRGTPPVVARQESGLMAVAVDPDYARNGWVYLTFSDPGPQGSSMNKIVRGRLRDGAWIDQQTVFALDPTQYPRSYVLYGGRLVFQGEYLFFGIGERGMEEGTTGKAQDLRSPFGKIHRVYRDGRIPADNPFGRTRDAWPSIWAVGVRNPQGLTIDRATGNLWETEHGPRGGDELNHIRVGRNYGWPLITYGINYDGTPVSDRTAAPGLEQPVINWTPSIAVSAIEFYDGDRFPRWRGQLFVGSLAQQKLLRVVLEGDRVVHREELFRGLGRIRDIKTAPDGSLYVAFERVGKPGRLVRLVAVKEQRRKD